MARQEAATGASGLDSEGEGQGVDSESPEESGGGDGGSDSGEAEELSGQEIGQADPIDSELGGERRAYTSCAMETMLNSMHNCSERRATYC
eukprot:scaffold5310_cov378-Prasinococcus_capsulatus_cf.AAC.4